MIDQANIASSLKEAGLGAPALLLVHSSLRSVGPIDGGGEAMIEGLRAAVGAQGTLMMPAFNYSHPLPDPYFDPAQTPGRTGALTEIFRVMPGVRRSLHPTHSVAAVGASADELIREHWRVHAFGIESPIDRLAREGGWVLLVGVTHTSNSTIHVGESHAGAVRFFHTPGPLPIARMRMPNGSIRDHPLDTTPGCSAAFNAVEGPLRRRGAIRDLRLGRAACQLVRGRDVIQTVAAMLKDDPRRCSAPAPPAVAAWKRAATKPPRAARPAHLSYMAAGTRRPVSKPFPGGMGMNAPVISVRRRLTTSCDSVTALRSKSVIGRV